MSDPNTTVATAVVDHEVTLETLAQRLDEVIQALNTVGQQNNWMVENLQSLFSFVNQMGQSGGGIRGLMHMLKQGPPELTAQQPIEEGA